MTDPAGMALVVMGRNRRFALLEHLEECAIHVLAVCDCKEARRALANRLPVTVVITDVALPDGDWRTVVDLVLHSDQDAEVIVCTRVADATLWSDALDRGVRDLLIEPFEREEVRRIVERAASRGHMRSLARDLPDYLKSPGGCAA